MTLISLTINQGYPVLMGDILLSSDQYGSGMPVPTHVDGTEEFFQDKMRKPIGLTQKLYVINDRLAVALGGRLDQMATFLNRIRAFYSDVNFDDNDLDDFLSEFTKEDGNEMFAIVIRFVIQPNGIPRYFVRAMGSVERTESKSYGDVFAGGSGAETFLKFVNLSMAMRTDIDENHPHYTDVPLSANLSAIGYFLSSEMLDGKTLRDWYGAGFEMIYFDGKKFTKLKDYTLVVMWATFGKNVEFEASPVRSMFFSYEDGALLIRAIYNDKERVFAIPEIGDDRKTVKVKLPDPDHKVLMIAYLYNDVDSDGHVFHAVSVLPRNVNKKDESPIVFWRNEAGKLFITTDARHDKMFFENFKIGIKQFKKDWLT